MTEFINWGTMGTYGGALAMVSVLTQFTKELSFTKKIPTQIWSYVLSFIVLTLAHAFTNGLDINIFCQTLFNAVIVSIAANGTYHAVQKVTSTDTDGELLVDTSNPDRDVYRLNVGSLDELTNKNNVRLKVQTDCDLSD